MKIQEILESKTIKEDASGGATASGAVATAMGGGAGFGTSIFMRRNSVPARKTKKKQQVRENAANLPPDTIAAGEKLFNYVSRNLRLLAQEAYGLTTGNSWEGFTPRSATRDLVPLYTSSGKLIAKLTVSFLYDEEMNIVFGWDMSKNILGCNIARYAQFEGFLNKEDFLKRFKNALGKLTALYDEQEGRQK